MVFQAVGLAGMLWLLLGPRAVGRVAFDVHTMLAFATMFVLGVQGARARGDRPLVRGAPRAARAVAGGSTSCSCASRSNAGLVLGGLLLLAGAGCFVVALTSWGATGFGPLDVVSSMRLPIVGSVLAVTGFSIITVSFTLSLTRIGER